MKPVGLVALCFVRRGVKMSYGHVYRAKKRATKITHGTRKDRFTNLRTYANELLKSNPNSNIAL